MKSLSIILLTIAFSFATTSILAQAQRNAKVFVVDSAADSVDAIPGNGACSDSQGRCTLRAAIGEVNAGPTPGDVVMFSLPNPSVIDLTLGEILADPKFAILGPGPDRLTIQRAAGTPDARLFHLTGPGAGGFELRGVTLKNGKSPFGGAMLVVLATLRLNNVVVTDNQAGDGAGVFSYGGSVRITRSLFHANTATGEGGAIVLAQSDSTYTQSVISDSTITNNHAASVGAISSSLGLSLVNSTITHNTATEDVSGVATRAPGTTYVLNTIIGSNPLPQLTLVGSFVSRGNNIITDGRNSSFVNGQLNDQVGTSNSIDPMLGPLIDNGGGIPTRALLAGSTATNAGNNCVLSTTCQLPGGTSVFLEFDQRARHRRIAGPQVDIGAFELNASNSPSLISIRVPLVASDASGAFYANSPVVLTDVFTGAKRYSVVNLAGSFQFFDVDWASTSIIEVRAKRHLPFAVKVFPY